MKGKNIAIAADHAGFELKEKIREMLENEGYSVKDYGTYSTESVDYPDYIHPLANAVEHGEHDLGIIICGSGNGVSMTANKHKGIRAALCWNVEIAKLARQHNNANVIALPARFIDEKVAEQAVNIFIRTSFEGGRHERRVEKISAC